MTLPDPLTCYARADLLLGLAAAFSPPDPARSRRLTALAGCGEELLDRAGLGDPALPAALQALGAQAQAVAPEEWAAEHARLFECGAACPPNETAFVRRDKGAVLGDVAGFYRAFGVEQAAQAGEKLDHVVAELEFTGLLLVMLGHAAGEGQEEQAEVTLEALRAFASDHLGEWLPAFCLALSGSTPLPLYQAAAEAAARTWAALTAAWGLSAAVKGRPLPTLEAESGTPYECDMAEAGIQGGAEG